MQTSKLQQTTDRARKRFLSLARRAVARIEPPNRDPHLDPAVRTLGADERVSMDLEESVGSYVRRRLAQHFSDTYMGVPMFKFPEDLRTYERFMWDMRANAVIELGVHAGGSTLWFRDRLAALGGGTVVAVDINPNPGLPADVRFIQADIRDPELPEMVSQLLPDGARPFIVEDTAHTYETTLAALEGFHALVPPGGYLVVEDGVVDVEELRVSAVWPRGVQGAVSEWLGQHPRFKRVEPPYGITCHLGGFLLADPA